MDVLLTGSLLETMTGQSPLLCSIVLFVGVLRLFSALALGEINSEF